MLPALEQIRNCARRFMADARFYQRFVRSERAGHPLLVKASVLLNRGLWLLTFHRLAHFCRYQRDFRNPIWWLARVLMTFGGAYAVVCCKSQILSQCEICGEVYLSSRGYLICGALRIGNSSVIHDHCTFGQAVADCAEGSPIIGSDVWIGPDCIIAGSVEIGDGATLLPQSFVTFNVPPRAVVRGNPARIVRLDFDNSILRSRLQTVAGAADAPS